MLEYSSANTDLFEVRKRKKNIFVCALTPRAWVQIASSLDSVLQKILRVCTDAACTDWSKGRSRKSPLHETSNSFWLNKGLHSYLFVFFSTGCIQSAERIRDGMFSENLMYNSKTRKVLKWNPKSKGFLLVRYCYCNFQKSCWRLRAQHKVAPVRFGCRIHCVLLCTSRNASFYALSEPMSCTDGTDVVHDT